MHSFTKVCCQYQWYSSTSILPVALDSMCILWIFFCIYHTYLPHFRKGDREAMHAPVAVPPDSQQPFLYQPGRALPLTPTAIQANSLGGQQGKPSQAPHIWEQPLPDPGRGMSTLASGQCQGTFPTMPHLDSGTVGSTQGTNNSGSWAGTQRLYDAERGWVAMETK